MDNGGLTSVNVPSEQQAWEDMSQHSDGDLDDKELRALEEDLLARCEATWKREFKLPWREAGSPNHHDDGPVGCQ